VMALAAGCGGSSTSGTAECGNGAVDPGEVCDGAGRACSELGASYSGGMAACRASCGGWDVSQCQRANGSNFEFVKPAERDPARFATARCNDGTPFPMAVRLAPAPTST